MSSLKLVVHSGLSTSAVYRFCGEIPDDVHDDSWGMKKNQ